MESIIQEWGAVSAQIATIGATLVFLTRRVSKIESLIEKKLNNGIKTELANLNRDIGLIKGHLGIED